MSAWLNSAITRAEAVNDWLSPRRQDSLALLREAKWPTRKTEAWRYTPVDVLANADLEVVSEAGSSAAVAEVQSVAGLDSIELIFIDGVLQASGLDQPLPEGLSVTSLLGAAAEAQSWAGSIFAAVKPARHLFGLVNDVLATSGLLIDIAEGASIDRPVRIIHRLSDGKEAHVRVLCRLGANAKACIIEDFNGQEKSFNTCFAEFSLAESAELEHYRLSLQTGAALSIGGCHFSLQGKAQLTSNVVGFGSQLSRLDVDVIHAGEYALAKLNAIYLLDGSELFDLHTNIEHAAAHGTTDENVRGIVADRAKAVFNGRIHIHRNAQKTLAALNNRNLLLSSHAEICTKPELEIYADDVRCAHGATVAQIDKKALFYLQSRGISKMQAQVMLSFGFINELVDLMPNQFLAEYLRPYLRGRFAGMEVK
ncbi:MAG: Fe-S cluster assembly protein SufD [Spongiibacteraceae bacterium]